MGCLIISMAPPNTNEIKRKNKVPATKEDGDLKGHYYHDRRKAKPSDIHEVRIKSTRPPSSYETYYDDTNNDYYYDDEKVARDRNNHHYHEVDYHDDYYSWSDPDFHRKQEHYYHGDIVHHEPHVSLPCCPLVMNGYVFFFALASILAAYFFLLNAINANIGRKKRRRRRATRPLLQIGTL